MISRSFIVLVAAVAACETEDTSGEPISRAVRSIDAGDPGEAATNSGTEHSGEATYYDANGTGACGLPASTDFMVAAINDEQYSKENCGKCVSVTGPRGAVVVRIVDKCPGCDAGDLDLSQTAFGKIDICRDFGARARNFSGRTYVPNSACRFRSREMVDLEGQIFLGAAAKAGFDNP